MWPGCQQENLEQVIKMEYLWIKFSSEGRVEEEVGQKRNKANRPAGCLNDTVWRNRYLKRKAKTRIYKIIIRLIMSKTTEIRADTSKTQRLFIGQSWNENLAKHNHKAPRDRTGIEEIRMRSLSGRKVIGRSRKKWSENFNQGWTEDRIGTNRLLNWYKKEDEILKKKMLFYQN